MKKILSLTFSVGVLLALLSLTACLTDVPPRIQGMPITREIPGTPDDEDVKEDKPAPEPYSVFFRSENAGFAMYEPSEGAYLAAWLMPEMAFRMFEQQTGKRHAVYVKEISLGDDVPATWVFNNIAAFSTPLFIVHPNNLEYGDIAAFQMVVCLARQLGAFNLPMFVAFYIEEPALFRHARNVFHTYAPMAAFVWVAPDYTATTAHPLYPGHVFTDWVALPLFSSWSANTGFTNILAKFETFYANFSPHKPIMILPLGISHFTRGDYTYRLEEAAAEISRIYAALQNFPRLGLIAYADAFTITRAGNDDYSLTRERVLVNAFSEAVSGENFLSALQREHNATTRWIRSAFHGYIYEENILIANDTLRTELFHAPGPQATLINSRFFTNAENLPEKHITFCPTRQVIFIAHPP